MGKIENRLLVNIGLCVPPFERESLGIAHKAMRSLKPEYGRDEHDAEMREKSRRTVIEKVIDPTTVPIASILPQFGFHSGVNPSKERGVKVSPSDLEAIGEKLIRGTTWVIEKAYIDRDHSIHIVFLPNPTAWPSFFEDLKLCGRLYSLGPGLSIVRAATDGDCQSGIYSIEIWGRLHMYGCVAPVKNGA